MDLLTEAYQGLFPDKEPGHEMQIKYSGRFSDYNANVRYTARSMVFSLSKEWKNVSREIRIGLLQVLMQKVYRTRANTLNIDMYNIFLKKVHMAIPVTDCDPELAQSFERVNELYFNGMIEPANLRWGGQSRTKYGSYDYTKDLITMNPVLRQNPELLDYVMYHEMLHKKLKFDHSSGRSRHHTKEFRMAEASFPGSARLESELKVLSRRQKLSVKSKKFFNWF